MFGSIRLAWIGVLAIWVGFIGPASAQSVAEFYKGKRISVVIGHGAGSGYDLLSRTVTRHMGKHIPGNPSFLVKNMPGASGRVAANWFATKAPRDGSTLASFSQTIPLDQARKKKQVRYDAAKFNWIGNPIVGNTMTIAWADSGIRTLDDVIKKGGLICGGTGASSPSNTFPQVINNLIGTKIRIIAGYRGSKKTVLAMQQGEVNCVGSTWPTVKVNQAALLRERKINILVQWGVAKDPEISAYQGWDVPLSSELAKTDLDRKVLGVINAGIAIGRPLIAPPDVPKARVDALRRAFDATMKDPGFLADMKKQRLDPSPVSGVKLQKIATDVVRSSSDVMKRVEELMNPRDIEKPKKKKKKKSKKKK